MGRSLGPLGSIGVNSGGTGVEFRGPGVKIEDIREGFGIGGGIGVNPGSIGVGFGAIEVHWGQ